MDRFEGTPVFDPTFAMKTSTGYAFDAHQYSRTGGSSYFAGDPGYAPLFSPGAPCRSLQPLPTAMNNWIAALEGSGNPVALAVASEMRAVVENSLAR